MRQNRVLGVLTALTIAVTSGSAFPALSVSAGQLLGQTDFEDGVGLPWHVCESASGKMSFEVTDGAYRITVDNPGGASNGGEDRWDCQFRHRGLTLVSGCTYEVAYDITASNNCTYYTKIGDMSEPLLFTGRLLQSELQRWSGRFTLAEIPSPPEPSLPLIICP